MSIRDILVMIIMGFTVAWFTAEDGVTTQDYIGYMCLWCAGWTFTSIVIKPLIRGRKK